MKSVTLKMSWEDLFGAKSATLTAQERRERWETWLRIANEHDGDDFWEDYLGDITGCVDDNGEACFMLDGHWCLYMGLPCVMNPYLTFKHGMLGMACMGMPPKENTQIGIW